MTDHETMTPEDIAPRIERIRDAVGKGKQLSARIMERELHLDVLRALSLGACEDRKLCAWLAASTKDIPFGPWRVEAP